MIKSALKATRMTSAILAVLVLAACQHTAERKEDLPPTGKVKYTVLKLVKDQKTGEFITVREEYEEVAERSTADRGGEAALLPQRVTNLEYEVESFSVGNNDRLVSSLFQFNKSINQWSSDVWLIDHGNSRLTKSDYFNHDPSVSADGKDIYFTTTRSQKFSESRPNSYIWRVQATGASGITRIGSAVFSYRQPIESADGQRLLFAAKEASDLPYYVWVSGRVGDLPTQLVKGRDAAWYGNNKIIFSSIDENTGRYSIWTINADGTSLTQIISDKDYHCIQPDVDEKRGLVAYVKQQYKEGASAEENLSSRDIYIYNANTGLSQQITTNISRDDYPKWSKVDDSLYFRSTRGLNWNIWKVSTKRVE